MLRRRPEQAEQRRPQHHSGYELAHHRRLTDALRGLAQQPADQEQQADFGNKQRFGSARRCTIGCRRRRGGYRGARG